MKALALAGSLAFLAGPVFADEITIVPVPGVTVEHHATDEEVTKTDRHGANGCDTKTVTRSDNKGDSVTKSKTNC